MFIELLHSMRPGLAHSKCHIKILIIIKITCFSWDVFSIIHVVTVHGKKEVNLQRRMMSCVLGVFYEREQASASKLLM